MDEALLKSGQFPNVAIMAGSDPKEVMREHGQTDTEHMDNGVYVHKCPYDSRELLEADVRSEYYGGIESEADEIIGWLDRQAAITRRECADERENLLTEAIATCTKKISKLEAERDALKEQINRFDVPKSEEIAENDTSKGVINNFDVQNDTREKLEADIRAWHRDTPFATKPSVQTLLGWQDRQAAITERECMSRDTSERVGWDCAECAEGLGKELDARCDKLKERIAELTAERDSLRLDVAALYDMCDECKMVASLTAERDQLSRDLTAEHALVVQFEHDNEELRDTCNTLRASVAGLKMTVDKLGARNE